jgi:hypothetical protein
MRHGVLTARRAVAHSILLGSVFVIAACGLQSPTTGQERSARARVAPKPEAGILWSADHETGDFSQWKDDNAGGIWLSSSGNAEISTDEAHSGRYSAALTIYNAEGMDESPGVRLARIGTELDPNNLPTEAYYSVWYYFPQIVRPTVFWNVFQWKRRFVRKDGSASSDPVYVVDVGNRDNGAMYFYLYNHVGRDGAYETPGVGGKAASSINIPLNRWVHFECYYRWSTTDTGRVTCWQDGEQIMDVQDVVTEFDYGDIDNPRQWTVNNYSSQTRPSTQTIYVDDAVISTTRIGPQGSN